MFFILKITNPVTATDTNWLNNTVPSQISKEIVINIYNTMGDLHIQLISPHVKYFSHQKVTWILSPNIFILNEKNIIIWKISCNQAILNYKKVLILNGYVYINKILHNKYIQSIITNQVLINLIDQNMISNNKTIIHGYYCYSIGSKMYTDFKTQTVKLFGTTYTQYETI